MGNPLSPIFKRVSPFIVGPRPGSTGPCNAAEMDLVTLAAGQVLVIVFNRGMQQTDPVSVDVYDFKSGAKLASNPWIACMGCAIMDPTGVIRIYGVCGDERSFITATLDPVTYAPGAPVLVMTCPATQIIQSSSITADATGYTMVLEHSATLFTFWHSTDRVTFTQTGSLTAAAIGKTYFACPAIDYNPADGFYYMPTLFEDGAGWSTGLMRTNDLATADLASTMMLVADPSSEGSNNSDFAFTEHDGKTYMAYLTGDQATWGDLKTATFFGTKAELYAQIFP